MAEKNRANGKLGGRRKNPVGSDSQPSVKATNNYKLETNNQKPIVEKLQRGSRLAINWVLPDDWEYWANKERPDLNAKQVAEQFRDFWCAKPGKDGVKLDWQATWRNWVRNQKSAKQNPADIVRTTVPMTNTPDPALEKIKADDLKRAPIPLHVLAKMAELRKKA
jgi:hypothetical protein